MMYWEDELKCPHCRKTILSASSEQTQVWVEMTCQSCKRPFKYLAERVTQYTTRTPMYEEMMKQQAEEMRQLMGGKP